MVSVHVWAHTVAFDLHAVIAFLACLVSDVTGSFYPVFVLSAVFSAAGLLVIATLESTSQVLIPDWEKALPAEAKSNFVPGVAAGDD